MDLETQIFVCDLRVGPYNKYVWTKTVGPSFNISARPTAYILACKKPSIPAIVELFRTNAETNGIDLNIKNKLGNTGDFYYNNQ